MRLERLNAAKGTPNLPNPAKPSHSWSKAIKGKGLDLLGSPCPNRAFSEGCADSRPFFDFPRRRCGGRRGRVLALSIGIVVMGKAYHILRFPETAFCSRQPERHDPALGELELGNWPTVSWRSPPASA